MKLIYNQDAIAKAKANGEYTEEAKAVVEAGKDIYSLSPGELKLVFRFIQAQTGKIYSPSSLNNMIDSGDFTQVFYPKPSEYFIIGTLIHEAFETRGENIKKMFYKGICGSPDMNLPDVKLTEHQKQMLDLVLREGKSKPEAYKLVKNNATTRAVKDLIKEKLEGSKEYVKLQKAADAEFESLNQHLPVFKAYFAAQTRIDKQEATLKKRIGKGVIDLDAEVEKILQQGGKIYTGAGHIYRTVKNCWESLTSSLETFIYDETDSSVHFEIPLIWKVGKIPFRGLIDHLRLKENGEYVDADILDFKTHSKTNEEFTKSYVERDYFRQLAGYAEAISQYIVEKLGKKPGKIRCFFLPVSTKSGGGGVGNLVEMSDRDIQGSFNGGIPTLGSQTREREFKTLTLFAGPNEIELLTEADMISSNLQENSNYIMGINDAVKILENIHFPAVPNL